MLFCGSVVGKCVSVCCMSLNVVVCVCVCVCGKCCKYEGMNVCCLWKCGM